MSAAAMANWAAGNSGVGPGVNKRVLRIIVSPHFSRARRQKPEFRAHRSITEYTFLWFM
jgi:hypothetical protein